jgi:hypothetical protein
VVNVGGVTPATSVAWGAITGTLSSQTDLQSALDLKLAATTAATTYYPLVGNPSGFLTSAPVTSVAGKVGVVTLDNTDISGLGTMSTATAADYSTTTVANGLYYPLSGNPSAFLVAADITGKANLASPSFTGNVSISSSTGAALFIEQTGTGNILTLHDQASDTTFVAIDQNGKVNTIPAEATNGAGFNVPHGVAPTTPVNGDVWTTTTGLFMRQNGTTKQYVDQDGTQNINGNKTFSNANQALGNSTATGTINVGSGATISASTKTVNVATGGVVGSTTTTTIGPVLGASTTSIGNTTAASTLNLATGATLTATTKAVNIGTAGVAGSTTNIAIGSTTGTSTTTLQGITNGITQTAGDSSLKLATTAFVTTADNLKANLASPSLTGTPLSTTAAADTNTTQIATTAYVVGQASSTTPANNGTAAVGTSLKYARADHVHATDTSRAPLASPSLTGTPLSTTAAVDTNTTQIATTAFVVAQAASATPLVNGTAAVGTSLRYARADHVHGTDTTRAPLASPSLTGTPLSTTAAVDTNTTQIATTAFVVAQAGSATPVVNGTAAVGTSLRYARQDHVHGTDTTRAPLASPTFTGTPTLPTGTTAVTQTVGNNTTAVATTAFVTAAIPTNNVKAWVNFNGTGTVAIRASYNVSSITDNAVGDYTVNFTTAMADVNYAVAGSAGATVAVLITSPYSAATMLTTSARVFISNAVSAGDNPVVCVSIFR